MAKQTVTAFFADREKANNAVLLLRRYAIADRDVTISPEAAATGCAGATPAHVTRFWAWLETLFGGSGDHHTFAESIRRGVTMVTAHVEQAHVDDVAAVLARHGSIDVSERKSDWLEDGPTGGLAADGGTADPHPPQTVWPMSQAWATQAAACVLATPSARDAYRTSTVPVKTGLLEKGKTSVHSDEPGPPIAGPASDLATSAWSSHASTVQRGRGLQVVGSDGLHVGTIDIVEGTTIKLKRLDPALLAMQHLIPTEWVRSIDEIVTLKLTAAEARKRWTVG